MLKRQYNVDINQHCNLMQNVNTNLDDLTELQDIDACRATTQRLIERPLIKKPCSFSRVIVFCKPSKTNTNCATPVMRSRDPFESTWGSAAKWTIIRLIGRAGRELHQMRSNWCLGGSILQLFYRHEFWSARHYEKQTSWSGLNSDLVRRRCVLRAFADSIITSTAGVSRSQTLQQALQQASTHCQVGLE